jgi:hypothetical protein
MKTNRFFSFKRFGLLLSSDFRLNGKRYLLILAGGAVIIYLVTLFEMSRYSGYTANDYVALFYVCILGLCALAGNAFPEFGNNIKTGNYLLLPASTLEKSLSQFLIYIVLGTLSFLLIFWADTYLARWSVLQMADQQNEIIIEKLHYPQLFQAMNREFVYMIISIGLFLFATRLFFKRFAFIKSIILLAIIVSLFICWMVLLSHIFYPEATEGFTLALPQYKLASGLNNLIYFFYTIAHLIWVFFLPLAYYKLKEKQV